MGLQDFGAEVKSVHNGLDVIQVAEKFQPHIIFADILLQKKNGYEVSEEILGHASLAAVPVVLMWSSFMELDQKKYEACGARGELEKPFDVEVMRKLISQLVESTKDQQIASFLEFPKAIKSFFVEDKNTPHAPPVPEFEMEDEGESPELKLDTPEFPSEATSEFNLKVEAAEGQTDSNFDIKDFEVKPATPNPPGEHTVEIKSGSWEAKPLGSFQQTPPPAPDAEGDMDQFQSMNLQDDKKLNLEDFLYKPETNTPPPTPAMEDSGEFSSDGMSQVANVQVSGSKTDEFKITKHPTGDSAMTPNPKLPISPEEAEAIIRQETRMMLQQTIKEQLPAVLEKVVREELKKVLEQELALKSATSNPSP